MQQLYDTIGLNYADLRQPDPRIAQQIAQALGDAQSVLNVGAGAGSYEPSDRQITAVEPSIQMINQRPASKARLIQASAEDLPLADACLDAAMSVLSIHHWADPQRGVLEMRRVARDRIVFLTYDPSFRDFWLTEYFPQLITLDEEQMPVIARFEEWLGAIDVSPVLIPHDCTDGFLAGYWRRPAAYLDERVRNAMSSFWRLDDVTAGLARLADDLESGQWQQRHAALLDLNSLDCGYLLIVAESQT